MNSGFRTPLRIEYVTGYRVKLTDVLIWENDKIRITVYPPFESDGASIPKPLWSIIGSPLTGDYVRSSFMHDPIYQSHIFSKEQADSLFLEMMLSDGVDPELAKAIYSGVVVGGHDAYDSAHELSKHRDLIRVDIL